LRIRFVNIVDLRIMPETGHPQTELPAQESRQHLTSRK
jgi:hypothetical protein